jgi:hypothetical protein
MDQPARALCFAWKKNRPARAAGGERLLDGTHQSDSSARVDHFSAHT